MDEVIQFLNSIHPLSTGLREYIESVLKYREIKKREHLFKGGHICRHIYFITKGLLRCYYIKHDAEICSWFMKEGDVAVSVRSFFSQSKSYEWIESIEECHCHYISYDELVYGYKNFPELNFIGRVILEKYYAMSEERLYTMRMETSQQRYEYILKNSPELILRVPSKDIASYLGMRPETMSRLKV